MSDQGILAATPVNQGAPPPVATPIESSDVGMPRGSEDALLKEAMAALEGGEPPAATPPPAGEKPKVEAEKPKTEAEQTQAKLSKGFAKLASLEERHERRVAEDRAALQTERTAFEAERAEVAPLKEAMARAKTSPLEALQLLGWDYKSLVDYVMADGKIPPEKFAERLTNEHKTAFEKLQAEIAELKQTRAKEQEQYEAQQDMSRIEHQTRQLFADGAEGLTKFPTFAHHFKKSPQHAQKLLQDVQQLRARHFNETCVRDEKTGKIIKPGEIVDAVPAVAYIERILADMQISAGNPGQPGAVIQTANAGAERQQAPKPLTPRDYSVTSMPSDEEIAAMTDEEREALAVRIVSGG